MAFIKPELGSCCGRDGCTSLRRNLTSVFGLKEKARSDERAMNMFNQLIF